MAGLDVLVLEARDRVGGRTLSMDIGGDKVDLGGSWIDADTQSHILKLINELGLETQLLRAEGKHIIEFHPGEKTEYETDKTTPFPLTSTVDLYQSVAKLELGRRNVPSEDPMLAPSSFSWDSVSVAAWVKDNVWTSQIRKLFDIMHALDRTSPDGSVTIFTSSTNIPYRAKFVIMAIPPSQFSRLKWTPLLPASRLNLFQRWGGMGFMAKIVVQYGSAFWREKGLSGHALSHSGPITLVSDTTKSDMGTPTLTVLVCSGHGRILSSLPQKDRKEAVVDHLSNLFGSEAALEPTRYLEQDWSKEEFSGGCPSSLFGVGMLTHFSGELRKPLDNIFFCGTETASEWAGFMDGAVQAAERAVKEVIDVHKGNNRLASHVALPRRQDVGNSAWVKVAAVAVLSA
ncbi:hypothetical protein HDU67_001954, partial [Dinochytrium kinnereticum]